MNNKDSLEVERLKLEIENARRPFFRQPASWITLLGAVVAVAGTSQQWYSAVQDRKSAADAGMDFNTKLGEANHVISEAQANALHYERQIGELQGRLTALKDQLAQWQQRPPTVSEVATARSSLARATTLTTQFQTNLAAKSVGLRPIKVDLSKVKFIEGAASRGH